MVGSTRRLQTPRFGGGVVHFAERKSIIVLIAERYKGTMVVSRTNDQREADVGP